MGLFKSIKNLFRKPEVREDKELESIGGREEEMSGEEAELSHHLGVIVDRTYEMEDLKREYELVTAYFSDIQKIEQMEAGKRKELEDDARKIVMLEETRKEYQKAPRPISGERHQLFQRLESEIPEGIQKLKELEDMRGKIKRDLEYLEGEKGALQYEEGHLEQKQKSVRTIAMVLGVLTIVTVIAFLVVTLEYEIDLTLPGVGVAIVVVIIEFFLFLNYSRINGERTLSYQKHNRAIQLQNKVKIKWLNNTTTLDYLYAKYEVNSGKELEYEWKKYRKFREEEKKYQKNTGDLKIYQEELLHLLQQAGVRDAEIWLQQIPALLDNREMVEVKHSLNVRRQKLREQMKQNEEARQNSFVCVKGILTEHPELKEQAREVLVSYHIAV